jgi:hypothetical protein
MKFCLLLVAPLVAAFPFGIKNPLAILSTAIASRGSRHSTEISSTLINDGFELGNILPASGEPDKWSIPSLLQVGARGERSEEELEETMFEDSEGKVLKSYEDIMLHLFEGLLKMNDVAFGAELNPVRKLSEEEIRDFITSLASDEEEVEVERVYLKILKMLE